MNIGLLGFGVVGGGVWELAAERDDICVKRVLLRSPKAGLPESAVTFDVNDILNDDTMTRWWRSWAGCTRPMSTSPPPWSGASMWSQPTKR